MRSEQSALAGALLRRVSFLACMDATQLGSAVELAVMRKWNGYGLAMAYCRNTGRQGRRPVRATARPTWSAPVGRESSSATNDVCDLCPGASEPSAATACAPLYSACCVLNVRFFEVSALLGEVRAVNEHSPACGRRCVLRPIWAASHVAPWDAYGITAPRWCPYVRQRALRGWCSLWPATWCPTDTGST